MQGIFTGCTNLKTLNLCNWNFRRVKEWGWMFEDCSSLQTIYVNSADAYAWLMLHRDEIELSSMVSIQYI